MTAWLKKIAIACLVCFVIGAGSMYLILSGSETKKKNAVLKEQLKDKSERETITTNVVSGNEQTRQRIQKTMKAIHANTENYISNHDNFIVPAGAIRLHDDAVLQRFSGTTSFPDAGTSQTETGS